MSTEAAGDKTGEMVNAPTGTNDEEMFFMAKAKKPGQGHGPGGPGGGLPCPIGCKNSFHDPHVLAAHVNGQHVFINYGSKR